jgi:hypothetical protein
MANFNATEWEKINATLTESLAAEREPFGLPERREKSVLLGTFNIRELGAVQARSEQAWDFLELICRRFDLISIQEVQDNLEGLRHLRQRLGDEYGLVVSDITGLTPGTSSGSPERLAFLFRWKRIRRTELASDISFDRSAVVDTLFENRNDFNQTWTDYQTKLDLWKLENERRKALGLKALKKDALILPRFLTFIRQPHCASFEVIPADANEQPYEFLLVNAHLLYGVNKKERLWEFEALIEWLVLRAKMRDTPSYENIVMMGDCNSEFEDADVTRAEMDARLKTLNKTKLASKQAAKVNFPLLDIHPVRGFIRTNARQDQTYDQIAIFAHDKRLPDHKANEMVGSPAHPDAYDYGAFKFTDLFARALFGAPGFDQLKKADRQFIIRCAEWDISDHMPAWFRLPIPGT